MIMVIGLKLLMFPGNWGCITTLQRTRVPLLNPSFKETHGKRIQPQLEDGRMNDGKSKPFTTQTERNYNYNEKNTMNKKTNSKIATLYGILYCIYIYIYGVYI